MKKIKKIHFTGIKGVGMTPLAVICKEAGFKVSGSDIDEEFITDKPLKDSGIIPLVGFFESNVERIDLLIVTGAHGGFENKEVVEAKRRNIPVWTQGQAVGEFMKGEIFDRKFSGISICGTHGKTTTTAICATIFKESGLDPSYVIGTSEIISLASCGHYGDGKYFIAEADEYSTEPKYDKTPKFFWQNPEIAVITNIELDHPDLYKNEDELVNAFAKFAEKIAKNGLLVIGGDDNKLRNKYQDFQKQIITYGFSPNNDYVVKKVSVSNSQTFFWVEKLGMSLGEFSIKVAGEHNVLNALGAAIVAIESGISIEKISKALSVFRGSKRRFEYVGKFKTGGLLYDDYAHHPTEIKKTLKAFRDTFPKSKLVCVFQPHTYSRTKMLFDQFTNSFFDADEVIITKIYPSLREKPDFTVSSEKLVEAISRIHSNAKFLPEIENVVKYIGQKAYAKDTVVITMGAGDIYKVKDNLEIIKKV